MGGGANNGSQIRGKRPLLDRLGVNPPDLLVVGVGRGLWRGGGGLADDVSGAEPGPRVGVEIPLAGKPRGSNVAMCGK